MSRESRVQERGVSSETADSGDRGNGVGVPGRVPSAGRPAKPQRRQFSAEFKARIVEEADACTQAGEVYRAFAPRRVVFVASGQLASALP